MAESNRPQCYRKAAVAILEVPVGTGSPTQLQMPVPLSLVIIIPQIDEMLVSSPPRRVASSTPVSTTAA